MVQTALWPDDDNHDDYEASLEKDGCPHLECEGGIDGECDDCACAECDSAECCVDCNCVTKDEEWDCQP